MSRLGHRAFCSNTAWPILFALSCLGCLGVDGPSADVAYLAVIYEEHGTLDVHQSCGNGLCVGSETPWGCPEDCGIEGFVLLPPGELMMGAPDDEPGRAPVAEGPVGAVRISRAFWLKETEVTQQEWQEVMEGAPSHFSHCGSDCPVEQVSWWDAVAFCNELSRREGLEPCYELTGCDGDPSGGCAEGEESCTGDYECASVALTRAGCLGYRLPTEAEWEYAARAGTTTALSNGPITQTERSPLDENLAAIGWYGGNSTASYDGAEACDGWFDGAATCGPQPVGGKLANAWGLLDMAGNVWEWIWDWYYIGWYASRPDPAVDPTGPVAGASRCFRGGAWDSEAKHCRSAGRGFDVYPTSRRWHQGFRPARTSRATIECTAEIGCDDGPPCTTSRCDDDWTCLHEPAADGAICDAGKGIGSGVCTSGECVPDEERPEAPELSTTDPRSPSLSTTPRVKGTAEPRASVSIFTSADCTGEALGTGTADATAGDFSVQITVAPGSTNTLHATATDLAGNVSMCSKGLVYEHGTCGNGTCEGDEAEDRKSCPQDCGPAGFVFIPPGELLMGSPEDDAMHRPDEGPQRRVKITRPFWIKATEVTQADWQAVMGTNPAFYQSCGSSCPVERVSWNDAVAYCNALSQKEGLTGCYELTDCAGTPGGGCASEEGACEGDYACEEVTFAGPACEGYRLPTEAEWEYAARAGTTTHVHSGHLASLDCTQPPNLVATAWYCGNAMSTTHPGGEKDPNPWGLLDTSGNVWEWVWDRHADGYYAGRPDPDEDPLGPDTGYRRVERGGAWNSWAQSCRSAMRGKLSTTYRRFFSGLRTVRTVPP